MSSTKEIIVDDVFENMTPPNMVTTKLCGSIFFDNCMFTQLCEYLYDEGINISALVGLPIKISVINGLALGISFPIKMARENMEKQRLRNRLYNLKPLIKRR